MDFGVDPTLKSSSETGEDRIRSGHRPESFSQFFGQAEIKSNLKVMIEAAQMREEPLEHILFSGPPGLGKTTLAHIISKEMGAELVSSSGPLLDKPGDLVAILSNLQKGTVLFIDEIHRMPKGVEETLYSAMEDFRVDIVVGTGPGARTITMPLEEFTLVGATTRTGLLSAPLRDRFGVVFQMEFYSSDELSLIVLKAASNAGLDISEDGAMHIAEHSRGTPRIALRLLRRVRDFALVGDQGVINAEASASALACLGIGELGLDKMDRAILETIITRFGGGPVGLDTLSAVFHEERDVLAEVHEPYLLKLGFLHKTARGRVATPRAYEYIGLTPPKDSESASLFN